MTIDHHYQTYWTPFLASPDAQEVIVVTQSVSESELADLTDVTVVSDDTALEDFTDEDGDEDEDYEDDEDD